MTQVWMLRNSDTDIHLFNRREHLKPSIEISYSRCQDVTISIISETAQGVTFRIEGKRNGNKFDETIYFKRLPIWTEPSHL
jgi:hypothetical protein